MNFSVASHNFLFETTNAGVGGQERSDTFSKVSMRSNLKNAKRGQWNRKWRTVSSSSPHKHTGEIHFLILNRNCLSLQWPERSWAASNDGGNTSRILALLTRGKKRWVMLQAVSDLHWASQRTAIVSQMALLSWALVGCWIGCKVECTMATNDSKAFFVDFGIRLEVAGEKDRFNTTSAILRSIGRTFAITAAALEAVDLKHLEILRRKGRWVDFSKVAHLKLREDLAQTEQLYRRIGRKTDL